MISELNSDFKSRRIRELATVQKIKQREKPNIEPVKFLISDSLIKIIF
jgi:hypothetical protein